ncbi:DUF2939 domain-containing protein [Caulobacter endophyticus]|uniref:DUF2939 domain-containing protein n=1 Tax=Caulobacter endophyticus TaxID=2172652 RepID=A0A2T9K2U4_9CAUL|nr:DUF2939 domain-containing protein [Caulobacter endophyticus]PVM90305.1 hypothetical protein DDF67_10280 [Caulobacter endophyticus]
MKRNSKIAIAAGVAGALFAAAYFGSPFVALMSLKTAAKTGDRDRLEQVVDFPQVREGMKSQLTAMLTKRMAEDPAMKDNPFAALGLLMAPAIIDRAIETYVTPDSISTMITTARKPSQTLAQDPGAASTSSTGKVRTRYDYVGLDRFRATLTNPDSDDKLSLVLDRKGLFGWRLVRVDLPLDEAGSPV